MDLSSDLIVICMASLTGVVYQIKNLKNGKIYIGCTTINFGNRLAQHIRSIGQIKTDLYDDMEKDIKDFSFCVIEDNIPCRDLRKRESHWIHFFQSTVNGYNQVLFNGNEKLTEHNIWEIKDLIISTNLKFLEIADMYRISPDAIADINLGRAWLDESAEYPLRKRTIKRKRLSENDIYQIYELLRDQTLSFKQITERYGWSSEAVLRKINNGTYNISPLPKECYPIRSVDSRKGRKVKDNGMF